MKKTANILFIVFIFQLVLTAFSFSSGSNLESFTPKEELLTLTLDSLSEIRVTPGEAEKSDEAATIVKGEDGSWVLKSYYDFPVAANKLASFSDKLFTIKKPYPVGSTKIAAKQFEVSPEKFKTKVEFMKGDTVLDTLYLGTSPTFKRVHARLNESDVTYSIPFSAFEVQGKPSTWIDRGYLKLNHKAIKEIAFTDFTIVRSEGDDSKLVLSDLGEGEVIDEKAVGELIKSATNSGFLDILGNEEDKSYGLTNPAVSYTVTTNDGKVREYNYGKVDGESFYALKVSTEPYYFKVSSYHVDKIAKAAREKLVEAEAATETAEAEEVAATEEDPRP